MPSPASFIIFSLIILLSCDQTVHVERDVIDSTAYFYGDSIESVVSWVVELEDKTLDGSMTILNPSSFYTNNPINGRFLLNVSDLNSSLGSKDENYDTLGVLQFSLDSTNAPFLSGSIQIRGIAHEFKSSYDLKMADSTVVLQSDFGFSRVAWPTDSLEMDSISFRAHLKASRP